MTRSLPIAVLLAVAAAAPALAETKAESCAYQSEVVAAIQAARIDRVAERQVEAHVLAAQPDWPERYSRMIPLVSPWVYNQRRRDLNNQDLGAAWNEMCMQQ